MIRLDQLALAQRPDLIVDKVQYPIGMPRPVVLRLLFGINLAPAVADEDRVVALPRGLKAKIVVDASIREKDSAGERFALQVVL